MAKSTKSNSGRNQGRKDVVFLLEDLVDKCVAGELERVFTVRLLVEIAEMFCKSRKYCPYGNNGTCTSNCMMHKLFKTAIYYTNNTGLSLIDACDKAEHDVQFALDRINERFDKYDARN